MLARETQRETRKKNEKKKEERGERERTGKRSTLDSTTSMLVFMAFSVNTITFSTTEHDFHFFGRFDVGGGGVQSTRKHTTKNFLMDERNQKILG